MIILKLKNNFCFILILLFFIVSKAGAQTTPCDLTFKDGSGMKKTRLVGLHEDLLLVSDTGNYKIINVDKISKIRFDNGNYFWTGMGIGAGVGFVSGIILYELFSAKKKTLITKDATIGITFVFTLPAALLGSLVGLAFRNVDNYDVSDMHPYMKSKEIKFIMRDHSEWR